MARSTVRRPCAPTSMRLPPGGRTLVLGTEELMYVPMRLAALLAARRAADQPGGSVAFQERVHRGVVPRRMTQFHCDAGRTEAGQKVVESRVVALLFGVQLNQQHLRPVTERLPRQFNATDPWLWRLQSAKVCEPAVGLDRELEVLGQLCVPLGEGRLAGPAVEACVQFDGVELSDVATQSVLRRKAGRVQHAVPVVVGPAGRADADRHDPQG